MEKEVFIPLGRCRIEYFVHDGTCRQLRDVLEYDTLFSKTTISRMMYVGTVGVDSWTDSAYSNTPRRRSYLFPEES